MKQYGLADLLNLLAQQPLPLVRSAIRTVSEDIAAQLGSPTAATELFSSAQAPEAALAGLWLAAGGWNEAHAISQDLHSPEGSYWHAIVHRQEPDASNAKYWFRQVGNHPIYPELAALASEIERSHTVKLSLGTTWNPARFVDLCTSATGTALEAPARELQQAEWRLLMRECSRSRSR